jgi:hypothetical protein
MPSPLLVSTTLAPSNASDALFRAWGSYISGTFSTAGMVQTADTGQINWGTVTVPVSANTVAGYEIWRFDDALQATAPIFMKIEYGTGATVERPSIWYTVSQSSDGAGALTGNPGARTQIYCSGYTTALTSYFCGDNNTWVGAFFLSNTTLLFFSIERTVDASGNPTADGVMTASYRYSATPQQQLVLQTGPATAQENSFGALAPSVGNGSDGTNIAVYPIFFTRGPFVNNGLNLLAYFNANLTAGVSVSFTMYGATHTFMPTGYANLTETVVLARASSAVSLMMRYE